MLAFLSLFASLALARVAFAANATEWRSQSIYQVIIDRYALPQGADPTKCDPGAQTWCGGTWNTLRENLDYIQNMGFTAVWISPVSQNYEGPTTPYGDAYHGYWIADASQLNDRFGTANDLQALSQELHKRGMYLMVDTVANNVMSTSLTPDLSTYMFKDLSQYHTYCPVNYSNITSEQLCWLGDTTVPLPDVNTTNPSVITAYTQWISELVQTYQIDGLRIDAAKHVDAAFWPQFCGAAGVYCVGEVDDNDMQLVAEYTRAMDGVLQYPMYNALVEAFAIPGAQNMSALVDIINQSQSMLKDNTLLGNFLENQDVPRWHNISVDPQSLWNAMVFNFMSDGIPIVYYGQEQGLSGAADPYNREALWPSQYANTSTYQLITTLNKIRGFLINSTDDYLTTPMQILTTSTVGTNTSIGLAIQKGQSVSIMTNIGSPPKNYSIAVKTPWQTNFATTDILTCQQFAVGSGGTVEVEYSLGGRPVILVPDSVLQGSGICDNSEQLASQAPISQLASSALDKLQRPASAVMLGALFAVGLLSSGIGF